MGVSPCLARAWLHFSSPGWTSRQGDGRAAYTRHVTCLPISPCKAQQRGTGWLVPAMFARCALSCSTQESGNPGCVASAQ
jgi:hypothetical protein